MAGTKYGAVQEDLDTFDLEIADEERQGMVQDKKAGENSSTQRGRRKDCKCRNCGCDRK